MTASHSSSLASCRWIWPTRRSTIGARTTGPSRRTNPPAGTVRQRTTASGTIWSTTWCDAAWSATARPRWRPGISNSGTSRISSTGAGRSRSSTSCTTTPPRRSRRRARRRVGGPSTTNPDLSRNSGKYLDVFLDHCVNGTNNVTGQRGTPLDFITFHVKGGGYRADPLHRNRNHPRSNRSCGMWASATTS